MAKFEVRKGVMLPRTKRRALQLKRQGFKKLPETRLSKLRNEHVKKLRLARQVQKDIVGDKEAAGYRSLENEQNFACLFESDGGDDWCEESDSEVESLEQEDEEMYKHVSQLCSFEDSKMSETPNMDARVNKVYSEVGNLLSKTLDGPVPRAIRILPMIKQWRRLLSLARPENWTAISIYKVTKIFVSSTGKEIEHYFSDVLYPAVGRDLSRKKKLNRHLFKAVLCAVQKFVPWVKGFLMPFLVEGASLRYAEVIGRVLQLKSIPQQHAAALAVKLAQCEPKTPSLGYLLWVMIKKRHTWPDQAIECVGQELLKIYDEHEEVSLVWHQCAYQFALCQRARMTGAMVADLLQAVKSKYHDKMSPLIIEMLEPLLVN